MPATEAGSMYFAGSKSPPSKVRTWRCMSVAVRPGWTDVTRSVGLLRAEDVRVGAQRELAGRVRAPQRVGVQPGARVDQHDVARRRAQGGQQQPGQLGHRHHVDLVGVPPVGGAHLRQRAEAGDAGRVHQHVQPVDVGHRGRAPPGSRSAPPATGGRRACPPPRTTGPPRRGRPAAGRGCPPGTAATAAPMPRDAPVIRARGRSVMALTVRKVRARVNAAARQVMASSRTVP